MLRSLLAAAKLRPRTEVSAEVRLGRIHVHVLVALPTGQFPPVSHHRGDGLLLVGGRPQALPTTGTGWSNMSTDE